jgi:hypothetical protein
MNIRDEVIQAINEERLSHQTILNYLNEHNISYIENINGYFFNSSLLKDEDIVFLHKIINKKQNPEIRTLNTLQIEKHTKNEVQDNTSYLTMKLNVTDDQLIILKQSL